MIFQAWVMKHCRGRPSEAVRRIEAANGGHAIDTGRVYRAMRRPTRLPVKFAQLVVTASGGVCSLEDLMDLDTVAAHFEHSNPDLQRRGVEFAIMKLERRRQTRVRHRDRLDVAIGELDAEIDAHRAQLAELAAEHDPTPLTAAG